MVRKSDSRRGNAIIEFGLASSAILLMALGALDFGRLFYDSIAMLGAAQAGVQRGTFSHLAANDTAEITSVANSGLSDVEGVTVTPEQFCDCPDNPGVGIDCQTGRCTGYGLSRMYIRVRVQKDFETIGPWPHMSKNNEIDLSNWVRSR